MNMGAPEVVTAVVCTRNRPGPVVCAVQSLLCPDPEPFELIVVDQSDGPETERALDSFRGDPRFRYIRSLKRGKGAALNEAIHLAHGAVVVSTDDDCVAPPGWISAMARALNSQPTAAVAFCRVVPISHDKSLGYVPAYDLKCNRLLRTVGAVRYGLGIGAGIAVRREFVLGMGGFDEKFGPGARFPSCDDWDIALRALLSGRHVYETSEISIVHDGFRTFKEGREHARRDWIALGGVCAKPLRAGRLNALIVPVSVLVSKAIWPAIEDLAHLRKPRGGRIGPFLRGFGSGLAMSVNRRSLRFL